MVPPGAILAVVDDYRVAGVALRSPLEPAEITPTPARMWQFNLVPANRAAVGSRGFSLAGKHLVASFCAPAVAVAGGSGQAGREADEGEGQAEEG